LTTAYDGRTVSIESSAKDDSTTNGPARTAARLQGTGVGQGKVGPYPVTDACDIFCDMASTLCPACSTRVEHPSGFAVVIEQTETADGKTRTKLIANETLVVHACTSGGTGITSQG
jgi:RNA polymerase subunit RPABC4/transcription elongation factor Spt4